MARLIEQLDAARVRDNVLGAREAIAAAAHRAGRDPDDVELLAAVKYVPLSELASLHEAGLTLLGENRAQELKAKATAHPEFRWHFIGQLQSRKVKDVLPYAELIHSVGSDSALRRLAQHARPDTEVLIEVDVAGEEAKAGFPPHALPEVLQNAPVTVTGLMTMPPATDDPEASRPHFAALRELAAEHGLRHLSMGTSQDYAVAVEEGATIVRLGAILYG